MLWIVFGGGKNEKRRKKKKTCIENVNLLLGAEDSEKDELAPVRLKYTSADSLA